MSVSQIELADFALAGSGHRMRAAARPTAGWIPAVVPGGVHESLIAAGVLEHPFLDEHERDARWIERRNWWYRTDFARPETAAGERVRLVFDGLDTVADVWLNGRHLGEHENMFRPAEFDVTTLLQDDNRLELRFRPPLAGIRISPATIRLALRAPKALKSIETGLPEAKPPRRPSVRASLSHLGAMLRATARRKPIFSWGWDFAPRVPSIGIWKPVRLVREHAAVITGQHVRALTVDASARTARVALDLDVDILDSHSALTARATIECPDGRRLHVDLSPRAGGFRGEVDISDAALWWTHDLGRPALHDVMIDLRAGTDVVDSVRTRAGLRTIELDRADDPEGGRLFRFVLNGVPIFARGACWVPASMLVGSVPAETVRDRVRRAREGAMTMLRVWGGGIYEQDAFYEACDEEGILVWQDFMFACLDYPSASATLQQEVTAEAIHQITRLRSHACLALWCGNNEVQMAHALVEHSTAEGNWGWHFFDDILPATVAAYDGSVPYWPGSPWGVDAAEGWLAINGVRDGDRHAWEVWHGAVNAGAGGGPFASIGEARLYRRYANDDGRFISEFGIHASPARATLERWETRAPLTLNSPTFLHRNKDSPVNKHDAVLQIVTGLPTTLDEYVDFTMASQAEGLKFGIEHFRRGQPRTNGALIWQFNDSWPGFSWSVVDFDGVPKAAYYSAARAFAPVVASFRQTRDGIELWVSNSGLQPFAGRLTIQIAGFAASDLSVDTVEATVDPGTSVVVWRAPSIPDAAHYAWVSGAGLPDNRFFSGEIRDLQIGPSRLDVEREEGIVRITAHGFAYFVHLLADAPEARFSDNYRDIRDGETVEFRVESVLSRDVEVRGYAGHDVTVNETTSPG